VDDLGVERGGVSKQIISQAWPLIVAIPSGVEDAGLEATDRMIWRQQVVAHVGRNAHVT
jgi:hypothetical protein